MNEPDLMGMLNDLCKHQWDSAYFFDDQQIGSLIYSGEISCSPSPAELLSLRKQGGERQPCTESMYKLRSEAYDKFSNSDFAGAESIYRKMMKQNFEMPGTLCHLARVQLLMNQEIDAFKTINRAWKLQTESQKYVIPRIVFFRIFFSMLYGLKFDLWIDRMHAFMKNEADYLQWDIHVVINEYREKLQNEHYNFLIALADVISSKEKCAILEQFEFWPKQEFRFNSDEYAAH
ncbi:MAG: hypothetical protein WCL03_13170 [Bacteroidota bacterium]